MTHQTDLANFIRRFETLSLENVGKIGELYSTEAYFKDPFNEVSGHAAIIAIFEHMFKQVDAPRFVVTSNILKGEEAFIVWDLFFQTKNQAHTDQRIHGSSHLRFAADGRVFYHRDYWDTAEELYEKIPVLGSLMRFLKRKLRA